MTDLPSFAAGDPVEASKLQQLSDVVGEIQKASIGGAGSGAAESEFPSDLFTPITIGEATGNFTSGKAIWKEMNNVGGTIVTFGTPGTDGRQCTSASDPSAAIAISEKQFILIETQDNQDMRYLMLPNPSFLVYLTQNGGSDGDDGTTTTEAFPTYTYDVFLDSAKTIKLASTKAVLFHRLLKISVTAATHGLAQWNGTTLILISVDEYVGRDTC